VDVVAYIDESGHHDPTGKSPGSQYAVMAGYVDCVEEWEKFNRNWQATLSKYKVKVFHFTEWVEASKTIRKRIEEPRNFNQSPYYGWELSKLDSFLYELAEIAGSGNKVLVGITLPIVDFQADAANPLYKQILPAKGDPRRYLAEKFFERLPHDLVSGWPDWKGSISVFYDAPDKGWAGIITSSFLKQREEDARLGGLVMARKDLHLPLQAADMVCYRFRQLAENYNGIGLEADPMPKLDQLLLKSLFGQFKDHGFEGPYLPPNFRRSRS
jgi:hypothetical protein